MMEIENRKRRELHWAQEITCILMVALVIGVFIRVFLIGMHSVSSTSMLNTLEENDMVFVTGPLTNILMEQNGSNRGDIVVFNDEVGWLNDGPNEGSTLIKRVIGVPGDNLVGLESGEVYINGEEIIEPYLSQNTTGQGEGLPSTTNEFNITLGDDEYWVMGDNRSWSLDSRTYGPIQGESIRGRVIYHLDIFNS